MAKKIEPLSNVRYFWEHAEEGYPDKIRLAMSDGKIVTYRLEVEQPKPVLFGSELPLDPDGKYMFDTTGEIPSKPLFIRHQHTYFNGFYIPKHGKWPAAREH